MVNRGFTVQREMETAVLTKIGIQIWPDESQPVITHQDVNW
jgi:hypothetical protein